LEVLISIIFHLDCNLVFDIFFSLFVFVAPALIHLLSMNLYITYQQLHFCKYRCKKNDYLYQSSRLTFWHTSPKSVFLTFFFTYNWLVTPDFEHVEEISQARQLFYWPGPSGLWLNSKTAVLKVQNK